MKRAVFPNLLLAGLVLVLAGTGCRKPQKPVTPIPAKGTAAAPGNTTRKGPVEGTPVTPGQPVTPEGGNTSGRTLPSGGETTPTNPSGFAQSGLETIEGMIADTNHFAGQTVYFEFDSAVVRTAQQGRCNAVADDLKAKPETKLMIDGHCDERGTEEYNRALGERRALAVREYLIKYGIAPERVFTRSYGEDRPADTGHTEDAWSKNRRAEFILLNPPK